MSAHDLPSIDHVRQCLRYEDGKLFWLNRPRSHFATLRGYSTWNSQNSGNEAGCIGHQKQPRWQITLDGIVIRRYMVVWALHHNEWSEQIDHEDNDQLNDKIENLRPCNHSQNAANSKRRSDNTSGYKGVYQVKRTGKFIAQIVVDQKNSYLGCFDTAEEAHAAYVAAAKKYFGEFAHGG